ncbi:hypothetical protein [Pedosphaera parvula]|uniref:Merozoite surface protein 3b n=1 Tax=Pedosphaera parvula (strain Ellin514) TaxID=320771 RepID=B9XJE2_PEDPL|nr:hypothetical protein [Pedosphaera parvula]EEF60003.1 conserved hypothetical protein [Pedosphaera parvula Ellin514]
MTSALSYLSQATDKLRSLGIFKEEPKSDEAVALVEKVQDLDPAKTLIIARMLHSATTFNSVVREQITSAPIDANYLKITKGFDSIRDDAKMLVMHMEDGKVDWKERIQQAAMKMTRGTIHSRFTKIEEQYKSTVKNTGEQLKREEVIIEAYMDFRGGVKAAELASYELLELQDAKVKDAKATLQTAQTAVEAATEPKAKSGAELTRDEALRSVQREEDRHRILKLIAENLTIAYNTGDIIVEKIRQTHGCKEAVYQQAVTFFTTNSQTFTGLDAALTAETGLHSATGTLEAMKAGANQSLEVLAEISGKTGEAALKAAYGPTIKAESVKKLVDAVVDFQTKSVQIIQEAEKASTENAQAIATLVEDAKKRQAEIVLANALKT